MNKYAFAMAVVLSAFGMAYAEDAPTPPKPDNTAKNTRERSDAELNPTDQKGNAADVAITQKIRQALTANKDLSTYAHNIKIITVDGLVNLKGPVRTAEEKKFVEDKAAEVVGADKVKSQIEIAPKE